MSSETLIVALSSDLAPVQRRSMPREGGLVLALGVVELALFVPMGVMRPDMHHITGSPFLIWRVVSLGPLAAVACVLAIRSFSPQARPRRVLMRAAALGVAAIVRGGRTSAAAGRGGAG